MILMLAASWQRWTQPIIDHGREMNLPARILAGEQLYRDVQFLYGPFAPYFNAGLYAIFGVKLSVLHTAGALCAAIVLLMVYWLSRQLMGTAEAALATALVLVFCALKATANYVSPYAYATLYSLIFALAALIFALKYWRDGRRIWIFWAGAGVGLSIISKWELALAGGGAALVAIVLRSLVRRRFLWREILIFTAPMAAISAGTYAFILSRVPWRTLLEDNHILFSSMPPQLIYFNQQISGMAEWPKSLWSTLSGVGLLLLWAGAITFVGALLALKKEPEWRGVAKQGLLLILTGGGFWLVMRLLFDLEGNATLLTGMPIVLPLLIVILLIQSYRLWRTGNEITFSAGALMIIAVFAQASILRFFLNVKVTGPYVPFFIPMLLLVSAWLLLSWLPQRIAPTAVMRKSMRLSALIIIGLLVIGVAVVSAHRFRARQTFAVYTDRGGFITEPQIGQPLAAAIQYAREHTSPEDLVLSLPQATSINFLAARRYPFHEEIVHPGFLSDEEGIRRLQAKPTRLIFVVNILTPEFRDRVFGTDYNPGLLRWIEEHYRLAARFDTEASRGAKLGDKPFFILAYEKL
jgi:4-amino-4-deoxy-L-arabinose transferase-like glycosyltransferase